MLCKHIVDNIKGDLWSDLEVGLYLYSLSITKQYGEGNISQAKQFKKEFNELLPPDEELLDNMQLADLQRVLQSASSDSAQARYKILITSYFVSNHLTSGQQSRVLDVLKQLAIIDTNNSWTTPDNDRPTLLWDINGI